MNDNLPYFIYALNHMGRTGIGRKIQGKRGRFVLEKVNAAEKTIYSDTDQRLNSTDATEMLQMAEPGKDQGMNEIKITLETPLRLKYNSRLQAALPFHVLVRAMLRRVSSLFGVYGDKEPDLDYKGLVARAKRVKIVDSRLKWFDWRRYSSRQACSMLMGGMTGSVHYAGKIEEYMPLIDCCAKVHLGKQTTFGLGRLSAEITA